MLVKDLAKKRRRGEEDRSEKFPLSKARETQRENIKSFASSTKRLKFPKKSPQRCACLFNLFPLHNKSKNLFSLSPRRHFTARLVNYFFSSLAQVFSIVLRYVQILFLLSPSHSPLAFDFTHIFRFAG